MEHRDQAPPSSKPPGSSRGPCSVRSWIPLPAGCGGRIPLYGHTGDCRVEVFATDPLIAGAAGWEQVGYLEEQAVCAPDGTALCGPGEVQAADPFRELTRRTSPITGSDLRRKRVAFVGTGASIHLIESLVRTGLGSVALFDMDHVEPANVGRTAFLLEECGLPKVAAARRRLLRINPRVEVRAHHGDFLAIPEEALFSELAECDLIVMGTDAQAVQLRGNAVGYALGKPMLFPGFHARAAGGEIVVVSPGNPCYRCQVSSRFDGPRPAGEEGADLVSEPGLMVDCDHLDSIVGKIALALLCDYGSRALASMREHVKKHSLILSRHDPDYLIEGQDLFGERFGNDGTAFTYQTLWFDPSPWRNPACPVCGAP